MASHDQEGHDHIPNEDPNQCPCLGAPPFANTPIEGWEKVPYVEGKGKSKKAGKDGKGGKGGKDGKGDTLAQNQKQSAASADGAFVAGTLAMMGVLVAAFAGVMYQQKTTVAVDKLVQEIGNLRRARAMASGQGGGPVAVAVPSMNEVKLFREGIKAHMHQDEASVTEATTLLD